MVTSPSGLVAVGGLLTSASGTQTVIFTSTDGTTWSAIDPTALGPSTAVVGLARTSSAIVLLTLETDQFLSEDGSPPADGTTSTLGSWTLKGPLQSWTSSDGRSWTSHPIPQVALAEELQGDRGDHPALVGGAPGLPLLVTVGVPVARSMDGAAWTAIPSSTFGAEERWNRVVAVSGVGFVVAGVWKGHVDESKSTDGLSWSAHTVTTESDVVEEAVGGPGGVIVTGMTGGEPGQQQWRWWSTVDGRRWTTLPGYQPLGVMRGDRAQECAENCPNGSLRGDSDRFFAFRGWGEPAAWTSADGRTWHPVALVGEPERSTGWLDDTCTNSVVLLPIGVTCHTSDELVWFGEATP